MELIGIGIIPVFVAILSDPDQLLTNEWLYPWLERFQLLTFEALFIAGSALLIIVFILKNIFTTAYFYVEGRYAWSRYGYITGELFRRYMAAPYTYHLNRNSAVMIRNITEEGRFMIMNLFLPMIRLTMNVIMTTMILILLFWVEPLITFTALILVGGAGGAIIALLKSGLSAYGQDAHEARTELIRATSEGVGGFKDIRILNREPWFVNNFKGYLKKYVRSQIFWSATYHSNKPVTETIAVVGMLSIAFILYYQTGNLDGVIPILALFAAATIRLLPAMREILRDINSIRYYGVTVEPIYKDYTDLSDVHDEELQTDTNEKTESAGLQNEIRFEEVTYQYPGSTEPAIKNLTVSIKKGHVVSFAGSTGSGKTTIIDLMLGLLTPDHGKIRFDNQSTSEYLKQAGRPISYIPQFIFLTDDTLRRNIAFGIPDDEINETRIQEVIEISQLKEVIQKLPEGLDTNIGERGIRLSGGERQRIGVARALYRDPDIIIMDEATSALDSYTENELIEAINRLREERTLIIISHRTTVLDICNEIHFLQNGKIIATGTLSELLEKNPDFQEMTRIS